MAYILGLCPIIFEYGLNLDRTVWPIGKIKDKTLRSCILKLTYDGLVVYALSERP